VVINMCSSKRVGITKILLFISITILLSSSAKAQVVVDISKITCDQFATYKIEDPKLISAWLDGYYHGTRKDMKVEVQTLVGDAKKLELYCVSKPDVLLLEALKTVLGISLGQP
jgi:acid stress chaperone HdeB